ncbi:hypothetical protein Pst134EB_004456 [Puccinia striiformis f. sp. tritici]|nr:hypothetical protein Pst134EB_004456 [Puccinia striiformis f. sp. tritici]
MSIDGTSSHACTTSTYLITSALEALRQRYDEIDLDADCRESPLFPIPGKIYRRDNRRFSRREALSTDELDALKDRLIQMQTRFLPSLQQQLAGILKSLESTDLRKRTDPERIDALDIISGLGNTLEETSNFLNSIAFIVVNRLSDPEKRDHDYGGLKKYRCHHLITKINTLMRNHIWGLIYHLGRFVLCCSEDYSINSDDEPDPITQRNTLIARTALSCSAIDAISQWSMKSDFRILQDIWEADTDHLSVTLKRLGKRIEQENQWERECVANDEDQSESDSLDAADDKQDQDKSPETKQPPTESSNGGQQPDTSSSSGNGEEQFAASISSGPSEDSSIRPQLIELAKSTIPLIKLIRIFFSKLSHTQAPFTISTKLSSAEIDSIEDELGQLACDIENLLSTLFYMYDCDAFRDDLETVEKLRDGVRRRFDSSVDLLSFRLIPLNPRGDLPTSDSHHKTWLLTLREHVSLADEIFGSALYAFKREMKIQPLI